MKILRFGLLFLLLACTSPLVPSAQTNSYRHPATGLVFPETLVEMPMVSLTDHDKNPGLGVSIGYNAPGITATVYLYTLGLRSISGDLASPILKEHFNQVIQDIYKVEKLGYYKFVKKDCGGNYFS